MFSSGRHKIDPYPWRIGLPYPLGPRTEDPIRVSLFSAALQEIDWESTDIKKIEGKLFSLISEIVIAEIRYYYGRRVNSRRLSGMLRYMAWLFGTIGGLIPIYTQINHDLPSDILSYGYFFFALAGSVLIADNVFAGTQSHQRYVKNQLQIEHLYELYALEYKHIQAVNKSKSSVEIVELLLKRSMLFLENLHLILGTETADWKRALDLAMLELKKTL